MLSHEDEARRLVGDAFAAAAAHPAAGFDKRMAQALERERERPRPVRDGLRPRLGPRGIVALAAVVALAVVTTAMAYPAARDAAASLAGARYLGALFGASGQAGPVLAEATSSGYTLSVTSAYDDGTTVVLGLRVSPAGQPGRHYSIGWPGYPTVTDSTGRELDETFTPAWRALADNPLEYDRPLGGSPAGSPLDVRVRAVNLLDTGLAPGRVVEVHGDWDLSLSIRPTSLTRDLPLPAPGRAGAAEVAFTAVRANDAYLHVQVSATGVVCPGTGKGCGVNVDAYGPDGRRLTVLNEADGLPGPQGVSAQRKEWQLAAEPGTYRLVATVDGGSRLERTVTIPWGRSATVPRMEGPVVR